MNKINGKFIAEDKMMATYLAMVMKASQYFSKFKHSKILKEKNEYTMQYQN